jgi:hypothetical protein
VRCTDSKAYFFGGERIASLERYGAQRPDLRGFAMTYRPYVSQLSIVTAYLAFAFVGAIILGVF